MGCSIAHFGRRGLCIPSKLENVGAGFFQKKKIVGLSLESRLERCTAVVSQLINAISLG